MWLAQKPYGRAVAILDGDGDQRTRMQWAASEVVGFVERAFPPDLWPRHQRLVERVTCIRSSAGSIKATIAQLTDAEVSTVEAEIRAMAAALQRAA